MYDWAVPGAKVVCVNANDIGGLLVEGETYVISDVCKSEHEFSYMGRNEKDGIGLRLKGFNFPYTIYDAHMTYNVDMFNIKRFRPLIQKKLPDALTSILNNPRKKIKNDIFDKKKFFEPV